LFLTHEEQELGVYTIMAQPGQDKLTIPIEIRGREASISISYKGITGDGKLAGKMTKSMTIENIPDEFVLFPNYPNPFNPFTMITYDLADEANVRLQVYDLMGRMIKNIINEMNETQPAGRQLAVWNAADNFGNPVSAGVYIYRLQADDHVFNRKMLLIK
jgi:hypothetical protein